MSLSLGECKTIKLRSKGVKSKCPIMFEIKLDGCWRGHNLLDFQTLIFDGGRFWMWISQIDVRPTRCDTASDARLSLRYLCRTSS